MSDQPSNESHIQSDGGSLRKSRTLHLPNQGQRNEYHARSPPTAPAPLSLREVLPDMSSSQFPLTNIDNPNDIAQELSNLQALRRLSMDVGNSIDPDMPPMALSAIPSVAPSGGDDENDPSRLLWVPARVHPELAPTEFKSFLESRVQSIRRRSGESSLSPDGDSSELSSIRRRKSMLSHQIDNTSGRGAVGYVDGAERLERQRSQTGQNEPELSLDELVKDPTAAVQKLTQDAHSLQESSGEDMPILPAAPGVGLRRSTRTTYRKGGSLRSGGKLSLSQRLAQRQQENEPMPESPQITIDAPRGHGLTRVQSEPVTENYSRPNRSVRRQQKFFQESPAALAALEGHTHGTESVGEPAQPYQEELPIRTSSSQAGPVEPQETEQYIAQQDSQYGSSFPQRSSSQNNSGGEAVPEPQPEVQQHYSGSRISNTQKYPPSQQQYTSRTQTPAQNQTLSEGLASSTSLHGASSTRTDALTFIPTLAQDDRKPEKKGKKDRDDDGSSISSKSSGAWKWFKSSDDKDKKKEESKKSKARALVEKAQDNARLDVLQTSIDKNAPKARESLVLDRDSFDSKLQEERKKESNRRSDSKKDKDGSIFSSIFGGSKKKEEKEKTNKKSQFLQIPEDPPQKLLQPDVDYNWTRFPLLEERAIYRMAHIKLANPRRPLLSQVLLSNFMYSYLAIVQAMHPQMNIPVSPQQKRLEDEARRKQQEQEYLAQQGVEGDEEQQDIDQYNFDYHRVSQATVT